MKTSKLLIILVQLTIIVVSSFLLVSSLCTENNEFSSLGTKTVCGYCNLDLNNTPCQISQVCNLTIKYQNNTPLVSNVIMTNESDGSYTYPVNFNSQGIYPSIMSCSNSLSNFEVNIGIPNSPVIGGGITSIPATQETQNITTEETLFGIPKNIAIILGIVGLIILALIIILILVLWYLGQRRS